MSRSILLAPHADDEVLFASFTILRHRPHVIIVLGDESENHRRMRETSWALDQLLHDDWVQWLNPESDPSWSRVEKHLRDQHPDPDVVYAPAVEEGGHEQHNIVGHLARHIYGSDRVAPYLTYTSGGRSRGREVEYEPEWVAMKLRALGCYESQIARASTRPWFTDLLDVREYVP